MSRDRYRLSFDGVAEVYERTRPTYAPDALAFIAQRLPLRRVLDLDAGTGKLTRQLVALGVDVVAVEPGDAMRAVLERVVPQAQALAGSAERIPLPDTSVDAVTVGQAFHALDTSPLFGSIDEQRFHHAERLEVDTIVGRAASVSAVAAASPEEQARVEERVRELVREREVDFPMITIVVVGDRV